MSKIRDKLFATLDPKHEDALKVIPVLGASDLIFVISTPPEDVPSHRVGHISLSLMDDEGKFWDAVVGAETETVDHGDGTFTHSIGRSKDKPAASPAKPALSPAVRKQQADLALLDMDCTGKDDLAF